MLPDVPFAVVTLHVLFGTRIVMNKLSKEINVVNVAQYEVACEEWQYNG